MSEMMFPVRGLNCKQGRQIVDAFLSEFAPETMGQEPTRLNVLELIENRLPRTGIHVQPERMERMGDSHGITRPEGRPGDPIDVLLREDVYEDLITNAGPIGWRARFTACHEITHAIVHVPQVRLLRAELGDVDVMRRRIPRDRLKAWESQEWQADTMAACMLAPVHQVRRLLRAGWGQEEKCRLFGLSRPAMEIHTRRIMEGKM